MFVTLYLHKNGMFSMVLISKDFATISYPSITCPWFYYDVSDSIELVGVIISFRRLLELLARGLLNIFKSFETFSMIRGIIKDI